MGCFGHSPALSAEGRHPESVAMNLKKSLDRLGHEVDGVVLRVNVLKGRCHRR
jgi:hypothetical protein